MYSIGEISNRTGIKIPTIRYYEQMGLITTPARSTGNQRRYSNTELERLGFIKHARELGFPLASIRSLIDLSNNTKADCGEIDKLAQVHLSNVKQKLRLLKKLETELLRMIEGCKTGNIQRCYVIESLLNHNLCLENHS